MHIVVAHYERYELHAVHRALVEFVTTELSAFYGDVTKDRLYTDARDAGRRRAAQVVQYEALRAITLLAAPILAFTAEDIWRHLPRRAGDPVSVHLATYPTGRPLPADDALARDFAVLRAWRERVTKALEPFRAAKHKSVDAKVTLHAPAGELEVLTRHQAELDDLFIVSLVTLEESEVATVTVGEHGGLRCERCWKWFGALAPSPADVCQRCAAALAALGPR